MSAAQSTFNMKLKTGIVHELLKQGLINKEESERIIELIKAKQELRCGVLGLTAGSLTK
jgi:hypothetical protein